MQRLFWSPTIFPVLSHNTPTYFNLRVVIATYLTLLHVFTFTLLHSRARTFSTLNKSHTVCRSLYYYWRKTESGTRRELFHFTSLSIYGSFLISARQTMANLEWFFCTRKASESADLTTFDDWLRHQNRGKIVWQLFLNFGSVFRIRLQDSGNKHRISTRHEYQLPQSPLWPRPNAIQTKRHVDTVTFSGWTAHILLQSSGRKWVGLRHDFLIGVSSPCGLPFSSAHKFNKLLEAFGSKRAFAIVWSDRGETIQNKLFGAVFMWSLCPHSPPFRIESEQRCITLLVGASKRIFFDSRKVWFEVFRGGVSVELESSPNFPRV